MGPKLLETEPAVQRSVVGLRQSIVGLAKGRERTFPKNILFRNVASSMAKMWMNSRKTVSYFDRTIFMLNGFPDHSTIFERLGPKTDR